MRELRFAVLLLAWATIACAQASPSASEAGSRIAMASAAVQITKMEIWSLPSLPNASPTSATDVLNGKIGAFVQQQHLNVGSADWGSEVWLRLTVQPSRTDTSASIGSTAQSLPDVLEVPKTTWIAFASTAQCMQAYPHR
ncbi:MAG: hypothetical protein HC858_03970 [Brachymonas sp.]|nr:hypothetical protein [Brachymonas sp.]